MVLFEDAVRDTLTKKLQASRPSVFQIAINNLKSHVFQLPTRNFLAHFSFLVVVSKLSILRNTSEMVEERVRPLRVVICWK
jgi:hypothetical protein